MGAFGEMICPVIVGNVSDKFGIFAYPLAINLVIIKEKDKDVKAFML